MASTLRKRTLASAVTGLVLIGVRPGIASEQPGSDDVIRSDAPAHSSNNRIWHRTLNASLPSWPLDSHVRSSDDRYLNALRDGVARSPTFLDLIGVLNRSDVIVYIESRGRMRTGFSAYLVHQIVTAGSHRYLNVGLSRELARDRLTGAMAHELQHAREVADATNVRSSADLRALFKRLDSGRCVLIRSCMETDAAVRLEAAVLDELKAGR
jgi:hypothetical protein